MRFLYLSLAMLCSCKTAGSAGVKNNGQEDVDNTYSNSLRLDLWPAGQRPGDENDVVHCTGQLIDENIILTAAHCVLRGQLDPKAVFADTKIRPRLYRRSGEVFFNGEKLAETSNIVVHPSYEAKINEAEHVKAFETPA